MNIKAVLAIILTPLIAFLSPVSTLLLPILWLVLIDIGTGIYVVRFVKHEALTSRGFFKKLPQVLMFLVAVVAALHADPFFRNFGIEQYQAVKLVMSFYALYEMFSILENLGKSGMPVAKQLAAALQAKLPQDVQSVIEESKNDNP